MKNQALNRFELAIYFIFIFVILKEWLVPIMTLTKTNYLQLILLFIAISFLLKLFNIHWIFSWMIKIGYIGWFIVYVYSDTTFFSVEGLTFLRNVLQYNVSILLTLNWEEITDPFRSILLFIIIWMIVYLIHYWITYKLSIFHFLFLTVVFIGTLDTFTTYDGSTAIVKILIIGLIISVFLYLKRLMIQTEINIDYKNYLKIGFPIIFIVGCLSFVALLLPKAAPQWPDPIPYIKSATSSEKIFSKNKSVSKVGYDEDDSKLGGPFVGDDTVLFNVIDNKKQYWRVETKDIYTSKGWESSQLFGKTMYKLGEPIFPFLPIGDEEETKTAIVKNIKENNFLIYPYGVKGIQVQETDERNSVHVEINENNEKFSLKLNTLPITVDSYLVEYSTPTYQFRELTNVEDDLDSNSMLNNLYLQLPENLPQRVIELANDIVAGKKSTYEKARAIEMYFRQNGFRYDTTNVAVPKEEEDYVDQFLFETKVGYCDNFSTSMVVLLRSVGIPARWVKGFVTGDLVEIVDGKNMYQITNNEAHSWVEAYIPGVGWVNFEPTIGFTNNRSIEFDGNTNNPNEVILEVEEETKPEIKMKEDKKEEKDKTIKESAKEKNTVMKFSQFFYLMMFLLFLIVVILFLMRKKWTWRLTFKTLKNKPMTEQNFEQHYLILLKVLEKKGLKRKEGQTLSSFALEVDETFHSQHMKELTSVYEQFIYSKNRENIDFIKMKEIWKSLVKYGTS